MIKKIKLIKINIVITTYTYFSKIFIRLMNIFIKFKTKA